VVGTSFCASTAAGVPGLRRAAKPLGRAAHGAAVILVKDLPTVRTQPSGDQLNPRKRDGPGTIGLIWATIWLMRQACYPEPTAGGQSYGGVKLSRERGILTVVRVESRCKCSRDGPLGEIRSGEPSSTKVFGAKASEATLVQMRTIFLVSMLLAGCTLGGQSLPQDELDLRASVALRGADFDAALFCGANPDRVIDAAQRDPLPSTVPPASVERYRASLVDRVRTTANLRGGSGQSPECQALKNRTGYSSLWDASTPLAAAAPGRPSRPRPQ
jgi:hypothetical protein